MSIRTLLPYEHDCLPSLTYSRKQFSNMSGRYSDASTDVSDVAQRVGHPVRHGHRKSPRLRMYDFEDYSHSIDRINQARIRP